MLRGHKEPLKHWKAFRYDDKKLGREDIYQEAPRLTFYFSGGWSLAIVICKDFLVEPVRQILESLAVNLVLVPSMTGSATPFLGFVPLLAQTHQAIVLMANSPAEQSGIHAVFSYPAKGKVSSVVPLEGGDTPGLCLHHPANGPSWIDLRRILD